VNWPLIDPHKWHKENGCGLCHKYNFAILHRKDRGNIIPTKDGTHPQITQCQKMVQENTKLTFRETLNVTRYLQP
jgi:hypothetical protein